MCFFHMSKSTSRLHKNDDEPGSIPIVQRISTNSLNQNDQNIPPFHPSPFYTSEGMRNNPKWKSKERILGELKKLDVPKIIVTEL